MKPITLREWYGYRRLPWDAILSTIAAIGVVVAFSISGVNCG